MLGALIPSRSAEDFASGVIRVTLGRQEYILDELPMDAMDAWSAVVDGRLAGLLRGLDEGEAVDDVLTQLSAARPLVLDALASYPGIPPADELRKTASHAEVLRALMGVWSAANPLVATLVEGLLAMSSARTNGDGNASALMSTLQRISDGPSAGSEANSPTANSSPDSTPPTSDSKRPTKPRSKPPGWESSSDVTPKPTDGGSHGSPAAAAMPSRGRPLSAP